MEQAYTIQATKKFDLIERTVAFAIDARAFVRILPCTPANQEDSIQLIRCSGSVGANYVEANESLGTKDFLMRIKICKKEAKECIYWLRVMDVGRSEICEKKQRELLQEATELLLIFSAIVRKFPSQ